MYHRVLCLLRIVDDGKGCFSEFDMLLQQLHVLGWLVIAYGTLRFQDNVDECTVTSLWTLIYGLIFFDSCEFMLV